MSPQDFKSWVAKKIQSFIAREGVTAEDLAEAVRTTTSTINRWRSGASMVSDKDLRAALFKELCISESDLAAELGVDEVVFPDKGKRGRAMRPSPLTTYPSTDACAATLAGLFESFREDLAKRGYGRGMVCAVDDEKREIRGYAAWGGEEMEIVKLSTRRNFTTCHGDAHVQAVREAKPQILDHPAGDPRAAQTAARLSGSPFAVFPLLDRHGRARWTLHAERADKTPIRELDQRVLTQLCQNIMIRVEEQWRADAEREWYKTLRAYRNWDAEFRQTMLSEFERFVLQRRIVTHCSISGHRGESHEEPILFTPAPIAFSSTGEFRVLPAHPDEVDELQVPVCWGESVAALLFLDHKGAPDPSFSVAEIRHIIRLVWMLSLWAQGFDKDALQHQ